ncbi:hypothetical protein EsH8_X_000757 [Colletotrichum jinshuiense]
MSSRAAISVSNPLGDYALPSNSKGVPTIVTTAAPVGYISTYPGYIPPTTTKEFIQTSTTDLPFVEGAFANYTSTQPVIEFANGTWLDCYDPSVKRDCLGMVIGTYYCTSTEADGCPLPEEDDDSQTSPSTTTRTSSPTGIANTIHVQSGIVSNCNKFYNVVSGDGCWAIAQAPGIALDDFYLWNPAVKSDCTGLQADVHVCVSLAAAGTPQPAPKTTAGAGAGATPSPVQEGRVANCVDFYLVQSGDGCWAISDARVIALDDLYSWNPAVKTDCSGLQANVYVCVGVS